MIRLPLPLLFAIVACGEAQAPEPIPPPPSPGIPSVTITPDGSTIRPGDSLQMSARVVSPQDFGPATVTWDVSHPQLATVSSDGLVRGLAVGTLGVRARLVNQKGRVAQGVAELHVE